MRQAHQPVKRSFSKTQAARRCKSWSAETAASSTNTLTADDIEQIAPYYNISEAQPIQIAPGVIGTTFTDEGQTANGNSTEEVWFSYRGNLYEVTADAKNGPLWRGGRIDGRLTSALRWEDDAE
jgi:hypothetical protein